MFIPIKKKVNKMIKGKRLLLVLVIFFGVLAPFSVYGDEIQTEVIITIHDNEVLAFSATKSHWVSERTKSSEIITSNKAQGNIGIVLTSKRILGFSVITDRWTTEDLKMNEVPQEVTVEGNVATVVTSRRVIGFSAHTGRWIEAP